MKIVLTTRPKFLLKNFYYLRIFLQGQDVNCSSVLSSAFHGHYELVVDQDLGGDSVKKDQSALRLVAGWVLNIIALVGLTAAFAVFAPDLYYRVVPVKTIEQVAPSLGTPLGGDFKQGAEANQAKMGHQAQDSEQAGVTPRPKYNPPKDESLPKGDWIIIPRIGVRSELQKTANPDKALETGIWWAPGFGEPGDTNQPLILAGHRYGWKWWWRSEYWRYHSFNKLPELEPGDIVEVVSDQRRWVYEIYAGEQGSEITDYEAHLILYTCKFLNSPVRYIRYARLVSFDNL